MRRQQYNIYLALLLATKAKQVFPPRFRSTFLPSFLVIKQGRTGFLLFRRRPSHAVGAPCGNIVSRTNKTGQVPVIYRRRPRQSINASTAQHLPLKCSSTHGLQHKNTQRVVCCLRTTNTTPARKIPDPKTPIPENAQTRILPQIPENSQCSSQCSRPHHAAPNSALRPLYVPYEMSSAPLAGVIHFSPLADINRDKTPDAVPAAINGVVYPME